MGIASPSKGKLVYTLTVPFSLLDQHLPPLYDMDRRFHWHECLEISMVKSGSGRYLIEDRVYPMAAGDIVIINNIEPHYLEVGEDGMHHVFNSSLTLNEAASMVNMSPPYFSAFFKRASGCGFVDYVNRMFRRFKGQTPSDFRKGNLNNQGSQSH